MLVLCGYGNKQTKVQVHSLLSSNLLLITQTKMNIYNTKSQGKSQHSSNLIDSTLTEGSLLDIT